MVPQAPRIGLDLLRIARLERALASQEDRWRERVFTAREWRDAAASEDPLRSLALCFAAKEAAFKALGTGWGEGVGWKDVEVRDLTHADPTLALHGRAADIARDADIRLTLSHAHTEELAVAMVLGQEPA